MAILSKRIMTDVGRSYHREAGLRSVFLDITGRPAAAQQDHFASLAPVRRRRNYAIQESINRGEVFVTQLFPGVMTWVMALEDKRMVHGGVAGGEVLSAQGTGQAEAASRYLAEHGLSAADADAFVGDLPVWSEVRIQEAAELLHNTFYTISGWQPELMKENRLRVLQQAQINQAVAEQRRGGTPALYAFEKERALLANIRSGDRNAARRILNDMLAVIFLSSQQLVVLRARAVELTSCLTRAAIEDNPLLEPLIESNHAWTEQLVKARSFEELSQVLMDTLDDFIDAIYLHGSNRSNPKVRKAFDFISANFQKPIGLSALAGEVGLSPCRLAHLIKETTGRSMLQILQQVRIRHAQHLLEKTSKSCTEIAYEAGYSDQSYFIKHFKRLTGTTPNRYRRHRTTDASDEA